ncbi:MAG: Maf family protein [Pseudomonadota bacterium]
MSVRLILASASPRREELLSLLTSDFDVQPAAIDETQQAGESPSMFAERMAREKVAAIGVNGALILGADTVVVSGSEVFGKPRDANDAHRMLTVLADSWHEVMTGVAVLNGSSIDSLVVATRVRFRSLTATEIRNYWQTGEPTDKAGAYGIQGLGGAFVERIEGSYSAVVGLPLAETAQALARAGYRHKLL